MHIMTLQTREHEDDPGAMFAPDDPRIEGWVSDLAKLVNQYLEVSNNFRRLHLDRLSSSVRVSK